MMGVDSLEALARLTKEIVADQLADQGGIEPVVFMQSRGGDLGVVVVKNLPPGASLSFALREILREHDAEMYILYAEAWVAPETRLDGKIIPPSASPKRIEVVQAVGAHGDEKYLAAWVMHRDDAGRYVGLGEDHVKAEERRRGKPARAVGNLTEMLPDPAAPPATKH